jgi:hypothetical protein
MNSHFQSSVCVFVCIFFFQGCISFIYRASDIREDIYNKERELGWHIESAEEAAAYHQEAYDVFSKNRTAHQEPQYARMTASIVTFRTGIDSMKSHKTPLKSCIQKIETFFGDRGSIESGTPEWEAFKVLKEEYSQLLDRMNDAVAILNDAQKELVTIENGIPIEKIKIGEFLDQMESNIKTLAGHKNTFIQRYGLNGTDSSSQKYSDSKRVLTVIEKKERELLSLIADVNQERAGKAEVWFMVNTSLDKNIQLMKRLQNEITDILNQHLQ